MLDYAYQSYTFKDEGSRMKVTVDFYDNTNIAVGPGQTEIYQADSASK